MVHYSAGGGHGDDMDDNMTSDEEYGAVLD